MAVNLENLLPQALRDPSPFTVPSSGCEDLSAFTDLLSPSMYSPNELSLLLGGVADVSAFESSQKSGFQSPNGGIISGEFGVGEALYQTEAGDIISDWMTTPMSLPLTPDEPTSGTASPVPPTPFPTATPTYSGNAHSGHTPLTPDSIISPQSTAVPAYAGHVSSGHTPLTPVSPQSSCDNGEELDDVLSYFADSAPDMAAGSGQDFGTFSSADASANNYTHIYCDSPQSSYTSFSSTPSSPSSTFMPATPTNHTPYMSTTPTSHTPIASPHFHHAIAPTDTIRDLLARDSAQQQDGLCSTGQVVESMSEPMSRGSVTRGVKRKMCEETEEVTVLETSSSSSSTSPPSSKRPAKSGGGRKKLSTVVKKERKREQNKNAALRYRQKKKDEKLEIDQQQQELEERNSLLRATLRGLEAEVSYLKRLWSEVASAKKERAQMALQ